MNYSTAASSSGSSRRTGTTRSSKAAAAGSGTAGTDGSSSLRDSTSSSTSSGRPNLHNRQHSANTAGDVFGMLRGGIGGGGGVGSGSSAARERTTSGERSSSSGLRSKGRTEAAVLKEEEGANDPAASPSEPSPPAGGAGETGDAAAASDSTEPAQVQRFKWLYSKPTLLRLWSSELKAKIELDELYSAFEVSSRDACRGCEATPRSVPFLRPLNFCAYIANLSLHAAGPRSAAAAATPPPPAAVSTYG